MDFRQVDEEQVLRALEKLPISSWSYKSESSDVRHLGPMAQDFMASFHVGANDRLILQVDGDGVALAAIKALDKHVARLEHENAVLRRELTTLRVPVEKQTPRR